MFKKGWTILTLILITFSATSYLIYKNINQKAEKPKEELKLEDEKEISAEEFKGENALVKEEIKVFPKPLKEKVVKKEIKKKKEVQKLASEKKQVKKKPESEKKKTLPQKTDQVKIIEKIYKEEKPIKEETEELEKEEKIEKIIMDRDSLEVDYTQLIGIMIEIENFDSAEEMLEDLEPKDSYEFYFLSAKLAESKKEYKGALKLYEKAAVKEPKNPIPRLRRLSIFIRTKSDKDEIKKELNLISELEMTDSEEEEFEKLKKMLETDGRFKHLFRVTGGLSVTDNVESDYEDKQSDIKSLFSLTYMNLFNINEKYTLMSFASYYNEIYAETSEKNSNNFFIGTELKRVFPKFELQVPFIFSISYVDGDEAVKSTSIGAELVKKLDSNLVGTFGLNIEPTTNTLYDYSGSKYQLFGNIDWKKDLITKYSLELSGERTQYSLDSENYTAYGAELQRRKIYKGKYDLILKYIFLFEDYDEDDRDDMINVLDFALKSKLFNTKWQYILNYNFETSDSSYTEYEYQKNELSIKLKRDF